MIRDLLHRAAARLGDVVAVVVIVVLVASVVTNVVQGFQRGAEDDQIRALTKSVAQVQKHDTVPAANSAAASSAAAAKSASDSEQVVSEIPYFMGVLTYILGQHNADIQWIECAELYGAGTCGQPPGVPVLRPPTPSTPAPTSSPAQQPAAAPRSAPASSTTTTTVPAHGHGHGGGK